MSLIFSPYIMHRFAHRFLSKCVILFGATRLILTTSVPTEAEHHCCVELESEKRSWSRVRGEWILQRVSIMYNGTRSHFSISRRHDMRYSVTYKCEMMKENRCAIRLDSSPNSDV